MVAKGNVRNNKGNPLRNLEKPYFVNISICEGAVGERGFRREIRVCGLKRFNNGEKGDKEKPGGEGEMCGNEEETYVCDMKIFAQNQVTFHQEFEKIESFSPNPDDSRYYGYYKCRNLSSVISSFNAEDISGKFYPIPTHKKDAFVLVKLQHAL